MPIPPSSPPPLKFAAEALAAMLAHCSAAAPNEACGLLVGPAEVAKEAWPLVNEAADPRAEYLVERGLFAPFRRLRAEGLRLLAIYHSHPAGAAVPSAADRAKNYYPDTPQVIVGLAPTAAIRIWHGPELAAEGEWLEVATPDNP